MIFLRWVFESRFPYYGSLLLLLWTTVVPVVSGMDAASAVGEISQDSEEYTSAIINVTFRYANGSIHSVKKDTGKFIGKVEEAKGVVVHVKGKNGTKGKVCGMPVPVDSNDVNRPASGVSWIALVKWGQCPISKLRSQAETLNASAVVFYDDGRGTFPTKPKYHQSYQGFNSVIVLIPQEEGEKIAEVVDNGTLVAMTLGVGTHHSVRYATINRTSVLFVSISFIILMTISLAWLVFYYVQRFRYIHAKDQLAKRLCSVAKKALSKIPVRTIKCGDKEAEGECECCAVCIEPYKVSDIVRMLPCKHQFHKSCVDPWLLEQRTCPMCKMDILKFYGLVFSGSQESILQIDVEDNALSISGDRDLDGISSPSSHPSPLRVQLPSSSSESQSPSRVQIPLEEPSVCSASSRMSTGSVGTDYHPSLEDKQDLKEIKASDTVEIQIQTVDASKKIDLTEGDTSSTDAQIECVTPTVTFAEGGTQTDGLT